MHVHQLKHFALGNDIGGIGQNLHDAHAAGINHHLEGARIQEVTDQHAGWVAKVLIGRRPTAAQSRLIHHVVV